jgi:uncharacterized protein YuzE
VTFRDGKPLVAYLYLPRSPGDRSVRTERREGGLLIDYAADGRPIGIEITAPEGLLREILNGVLADLNQEPVTDRELAPLDAA